MIAIVSHDAGGAEILSSWLRRCEEPYCLVLDGPAKDIFQRKIGVSLSIPLSEAIKQSDWVLCGTSWQSNLERQAIARAKAAGKRSVAFLDHWVYYEVRFQDQGVAVYPDELWVGDMEAKRIAQTAFPGLPIVLKSNPYFEDLQIEFEKIKISPLNSKQCSVLYVCEPIREHALLQHGDERYWGYTEEDALRFFVKNINVIGCTVSKIKIRPHPSESKTKYDWIGWSTSLTIEIGGDKTLLEETAEADVVVGCESMAMVVGLLAKKRVISSIPPGGKSCSLPQPEIEHLQLLLKDYQRSPHV
ncbi:MAG: hypothetical protein ABFD51_13360 [Anaerolineaceae bacterium]|nr:hypothetical protein [Betaproteobacteria bacterium]